MIMSTYSSCEQLLWGMNPFVRSIKYRAWAFGTRFGSKVSVGRISIFASIFSRVYIFICICVCARHLFFTRIYIYIYIFIYVHVYIMYIYNIYVHIFINIKM